MKSEKNVVPSPAPRTADGNAASIARVRARASCGLRNGTIPVVSAIRQAHRDQTSIPSHLGRMASKKMRGGTRSAFIRAYSRSFVVFLLDILPMIGMGPLTMRKRVHTNHEFPRAVQRSTRVHYRRGSAGSRESQISVSVKSAKSVVLSESLNLGLIRLDSPRDTRSFFDRGLHCLHEFRKS